MRIEYENTFLDILRFNASHQFRNVALQVLYALIVIFIIVAELNYKGDDGKRATLQEAVITGTYWYIAIWIFQFIFNVFYLFSRNNMSVITSHVIEIQDDSLYEETPYNKSYFYWNGIYKVKKIWGFIAVYVTPHMAHIIPNKAFKSIDERLKFYNELISRSKNA